MNGTGGVNGLDGTAVGTDEVVAVDSGKKKGEVGRSFVEAETADHALVAEALQEAEDGRFVTLFGEVSARGEFGQGHRSVVVGETGEDSFEGLGATEAGGSGFFEEVVVEGHGLGRCAGVISLK